MVINLKSGIFACITLFGLCHGAFKLEERYSWNQLDFVFPTQSMKDIALASGTYIPQNALPVGIEHWGNRLFVTVPRWRDGENCLKNKISYLPSERFELWFFRQKIVKFHRFEHFTVLISCEDDFIYFRIFRLTSYVKI